MTAYEPCTALVTIYVRFDYCNSLLNGYCLNRLQKKRTELYIFFVNLLNFINYLYLLYTLLIQKIHTHTSITLHTDYIHDKYNIDYVIYKHTHTHKSNYHLHCNT